jgi:predicted RNA methylase
VPAPQFANRLQTDDHGAFLDRMRHKYTCPEFVRVEPGDTVIDAGSFIGEFVLAIPHAGRVLAVEPDPNSAFIARKTQVN